MNKEKDVMNEIPKVKTTQEYIDYMAKQKKFEKELREREVIFIKKIQSKLTPTELLELFQYFNTQSFTEEYEGSLMTVRAFSTIGQVKGGTAEAIGLDEGSKRFTADYLRSKIEQLAYPVTKTDIEVEESDLDDWD